MTTSTEEQEDYILNIVAEFSRDLTAVFPEYAYLWKKWETVPTSAHDRKHIMGHLRQVYLARFFDILYQSEAIFSGDSNTNLQFLPGVDFRLLMLCKDVSDNTKQSIWKYLQLITFALLKCDGKDQEETMRNFFDGDAMGKMDEEMLKSKIAEAMDSMRGFFSTAASADDDDDDDDSDVEEVKYNTKGDEDAEEDGYAKPLNPGKFFKNMFGGKGGMFEKMFSGLNNDGNPQDILDRLKEMMGGKIGKLATELMEEAADDFRETFGDDAELNDLTSMPEVAKKILKDPTKIMPLVEKLRAKVDAKMKSGDISREELQKEAEEMMNKMGMDSSNIQEMAAMMMKQMGGLGKGMRMDTNAMNNHFKKTSMREKMRERYERRKAAEAAAKAAVEATEATNKAKNLQNRVFTIGDEKQEKSKAPVAWDLDKIAAEIEGIGAKPTEPPKKKKSKK